MKRLERVYVDLCGPMAVTSCAGNVYSMNIIDDFSGYVWTIPLRSKADACPSFQSWHKAVTMQTGDKLRTLVTDNGELVSNSMQVFCLSEGINHERTAPYTSAQNGRAERLHRTILGKARTMQIACNAPGFLWDEFCATATYLTTLTAATANLGRTPYELWFGHKLSLSHLREIGCCAFATHTPPPSKIYARLRPCILISYAPHAKAYWLWDPVTSQLFNSYHVTFSEHLDTQPTSFQPGMILGTSDTSLAPSWDASGPIPPSKPPSPPSPFSSLPDPPPSNFHYDDPSSPNFIPVPQNTSATSNVNTSTNTVNPPSDTSSNARNESEPSRNTVSPTTNDNTTVPTITVPTINPPLPLRSLLVHLRPLLCVALLACRPSLNAPLVATIPSLSLLNTLPYAIPMISFPLISPSKDHLHPLTPS